MKICFYVSVLIFFGYVIGNAVVLEKEGNAEFECSQWAVVSKLQENIPWQHIVRHINDKKENL